MSKLASMTYGRSLLMAEVPQLDDEPTEDYLCFVDWCARGGARIPSDDRKLSLQWGWEDRLARSPYGTRMARVAEDLQLKMDQLATEEGLAGATRQLANRTIAKLLAMDTVAAEPVADLKDLASVLKAVVEVDRLEAGLSTENVSMHLTYPDLSEISSDDLFAARKKIVEESD